MQASLPVIDFMINDSLNLQSCHVTHSFIHSFRHSFIPSFINFQTQLLNAAGWVPGSPCYITISATGEVSECEATCQATPQIAIFEITTFSFMGSILIFLAIALVRWTAGMSNSKSYPVIVTFSDIFCITLNLNIYPSSPATPKENIS